jgi:hypothetical protein
MPRGCVSTIRAGLCVLVFGAACALVLAQAPKPDLSGKTTVRGIIADKGDTWIELLPDGEKVPQRFLLVPPGRKLDAKGTELMRGILIGSEAEVAFTANHMISMLMFFGPPGSSGLVTGTVTGVSTTGTGYLEVRDDAGRTERYWPVHRAAGNGQAGGYDEDMMAAFKVRNVGDRVEIRRTMDHHVCVVTMRLLALADKPTTLPGGEAGAVVGVVTEKSKDWIVIKGDDGTKERYTPQRIVGSPDQLDQDMLRAIGATFVGRRVEGKWFRDGDRRLYSLKPAPPAK